MQNALMVCQKRKKQTKSEEKKQKKRVYVSATVQLRGVWSCYIRTGFTARVQRNVQGPFLKHDSKIMEV